MPATERRLDLLKTLGDNTRYAIYLELARSPRPLATSEIAESLGLHPNTVRPHLERMREVGLLDSRPDTRGAVGRPQKLYELASDAPSLGLEPPVFPMLARMLLGMAAVAGLDPELAADAGRDEGRRLAHRPRDAAGSASGGATTVDASVGMLDELGFDPARVDEPSGSTVAFCHCPFADLAAAEPDLVCSLHRGLLDGYVDELGEATVVSFNDLAHREPCRARIAQAR